MPPKIIINNLTRRKKINTAAIKKIARQVLSTFGRSDAAIDITLVSDKRIRALNKKYMGRNSATDVLSFEFGKSPIPNSDTLVGDIYISFDTALANARRFNTSFEEEILLYVTHGILHLLGFKDGTTRAKEQMHKLEKDFLYPLGNNSRRPRSR